jgi:hypothetical protein
VSRGFITDADELLDVHGEGDELSLVVEHGVVVVASKVTRRWPSPFARTGTDRAASGGADARAASPALGGTLAVAGIQ